MENTILQLNWQEARKFFLDEEKYYTFDLPWYFSFWKLLWKISNQIQDKEIESFFSRDQHPKNIENINYTLFHNKDGEYWWRALKLVHPVLYVALVHKITKEENWIYLQKKFEEFKTNSVVNCFSIPVLPKEQSASYSSVQANTWVRKIEEQSMILSLKFDYLLKTDIVSCYASLYTHSIARALHWKEQSKNNRTDKTFLGNNIDWYIQLMSYGQTNGIPEWPVIMDFIVEAVLGYVDWLLTDSIKDIKKEEYEIYRFRDDYRIFVNNPSIWERILKELTQILGDFWLKINANKTIMEKDFLAASMKADKLAYLDIQQFIANSHFHSDIDNKFTTQTTFNIQQKLLLMYRFSKLYPNSWSLVKGLNIIYRQISSWRQTRKDPSVLISIVTEIAYKNPRTYTICVSLLSKLLSFNNDEVRKKLLEKIHLKFKKIPNTWHLEVWLQRLSYPIQKDILYSDQLCKVVLDKSVSIRDNSWLKGNLFTTMESTDIVDRKVLENLDRIIQEKEVDFFEKKNPYKE